MEYKVKFIVNLYYKYTFKVIYYIRYNYEYINITEPRITINE